MASPQKEHGYVPVANEIYDAFVRTRIPGEARQVLDLIIRKTYGYQKKEDAIALSQFVEKTGMRKPDVCRALAKLLTMNVIVSEKANDRFGVTKYSLNKNYEKWQPLAKKLTLVSEKANAKIKKPLRHMKTPLAKKRHTKDKYKDNTTKDNSEPCSPDVAHIIKLFESTNQNCKRYYGNKTQREAVENLIESYGTQRLEDVIEKTLPKTNKIPYFPTITTPVQLRDKWATLEAQIVKSRNEKIIKGKGKKVE